MITISEATSTAECYVQDIERQCGIPLKLLKEHTIERDFGWAFFYGKATPPGSSDIDDDEALTGNAPIIIDKKDRSIHDTGTAYPVQRYLDNYERTGNPYSE